jgi:hypothetical protein
VKKSRYISAAAAEPCVTELGVLFCVRTGLFGTLKLLASSEVVLKVFRRPSAASFRVFSSHFVTMH